MALCVSHVLRTAVEWAQGTSCAYAILRAGRTYILYTPREDIVREERARGAILWPYSTMAFYTMALYTMAAVSTTTSIYTGARVEPPRAQRAARCARRHGVLRPLLSLSLSLSGYMAATVAYVCVTVHLL